MQTQCKELAIVKSQKLKGKGRPGVGQRSVSPSPTFTVGLGHWQLASRLHRAQTKNRHDNQGYTVHRAIIKGVGVAWFAG